MSFPKIGTQKIKGGGKVTPYTPNTQQTRTHTSLTGLNGRYNKTIDMSSSWITSQGIKLLWLFSKGVDNTFPGDAETEEIGIEIKFPLCS